MKNRKLLICICVFSIVIAGASEGLTFAKKMHQAINGNIAQRTISGFSLNNYLKNQLDFKDGVTTSLYSYSEMLKQETERMVWQWLGEGGYMEDEPEGPLRYPTNTARNNRHFHNPLKPWNNAGLSTIVFTTESLVLWAQDTQQDVGGNWSWHDARDYFYKGLTATSKKEREDFFAKTFRALGQQMHLVQDTSVPGHVRNDIHILKAYEGYVEDIRNDRNKPEIWGGWIGSPITYDKSILDIISTHPSAQVPIARIIDTDLYKEDNPNITRTVPNTPQLIGLAEYTNANFLSEDTMFTEYYPPIHGHYFPYPRAAATSLWQDDTNKRKYLQKIGEGDNVDHLAAVSVLYSYRLRYFPQYYEFLPVGLDDKCYEESASKLIPRAVGYSAGLLDYFFRGKIEITEPLAIGGSISLLAKNVTASGEEMSDGDIKLVAKYSIKDDPTNAIYYQVADIDNSTSSIPKDDPIELSFPITIPENAKDITLQIVYKGELGKEEEAVAVGLTPYIPKPVVILYKNLGTEQEPRYDWWYYIVDENQGDHKDPKVSFPSKPEIISKWWSCEGMEEVEYFTRVSPALKIMGSGGSGDDCGLLNFRTDLCCGSASGLPTETTNWTVSPCGGTTSGLCWYSIPGFGWIQWPCSKTDTTCDGCGDGTQSMYFPAANNSRTRTSNQTRTCALGHSWDLSVGNLEEKIDVGPRTATWGNESSSIYSVLDARCSPIEKHWYRCYAGWDKNTCVCTNRMGWLPTHLSMVCEGDLSCLGMQGDYGDGKAYRMTDTYGAQYGSNQQGCVSFKRTTRGTSGYNDNTVPLKTRVKVGTKETLFNGQWSEHNSQQASEQVDNWTIGWTGGACISCSPSRVIGTSKLAANYTYSELSYGVAGWDTVVTNDGKFAVLIPRLNLSASATNSGGSASGSISSTTTALLRIVDGSEIDFELAQADMGYALNGMPGSRDGLGIKPNCWPRDLPLDIELRGLHWFSDDAFLVTFMLKEKFYAHLFKKQDGAWSGLQLVSFEEWVNNNDLTGHVMFLK